MPKKIISRVFFNKKTGQAAVFPSKKKIKAIDPTIKESDDLFAKIEIFRRKKKNG